MRLPSRLNATLWTNGPKGVLRKTDGCIGNGRIVAAGQKLSAAAELRRSVDESLLDATGARDARRAWKNLLGLGQARARLATAKAPGERAQAVIRRVDQRIAEHVDSLNRMYTAADAASAAGLSLDDAALRSVETTLETLDEVSKAMMEEVA